jgi:hypothetical protein
VFLKVAGGCKTRILKAFSVLRFARCCGVLRPQWRQSGVKGSPSTSRFTRSLKKLSAADHISDDRDTEALVAAMILPYSQGQTEGQVNKLKLIKRSIYGRGKFDLLRQRVLYAVTG